MVIEERISYLKSPKVLKVSMRIVSLMFPKIFLKKFVNHFVWLLWTRIQMHSKDLTFLASFATTCANSPFSLHLVKCYRKVFIHYLNVQRLYLMFESIFHLSKLWAWKCLILFVSICLWSAACYSLRIYFI